MKFVWKWLAAWLIGNTGMTILGLIAEAYNITSWAFYIFGTLIVYAIVTYAVLKIASGDKI